MQLTEDDVATALARAFQMRGVPVHDDGVKVTNSNGLFHLNVRLSADVKPLKKLEDSDQGAALLVLGAVHVTDKMARLTLRIVVVVTSEIVETAEADAAGQSGCGAVCRGKCDQPVATLNQ